MGTITTIGFNGFPQQYNVTDSANGGVGRKVIVRFNNDTRETATGVIIRDDREAPFATIIQLSDGKIVLATECQYTPLSNVDMRLFEQFTFDISESWILEHT